MLAVFLLLTSRYYAQSQLNEVKPSGKMTLDVNVNKRDISLLEPITVQLKYYNNTDQIVIAPPPKFDRLQIEVTSSDSEETKIFGDLFGLSINNPAQNREFVPNETIEETGIIFDTGRFFNKAGSYQVKFILGIGKTATTSSPIQLNISEPIGTERDAYNFLKGVQKRSLRERTDWRSLKDKQGQLLLQTFVKDYGETVYGEYFVSLLANYLYEIGETDKAQILLERLKNSKNQVIAERANQRFVAIEKNRKEKENDRVKPQ